MAKGDVPKIPIIVQTREPATIVSLDIFSSLPGMVPDFMRWPYIPSSFQAEAPQSFGIEQELRCMGRDASPAPAEIENSDPSLQALIDPQNP